MRRFAALVAVATLAGLVISGPGASPADAHDVLVGSSPEDGATVTEAPDAVELTFNNAIQDRFAQVAVLDANETPVQQGEAQVAGPTVTQAVGDLPDGEYTISYRIISSDGHPVSGELTFTVSAGADAAPTDSAPSDTGTSDTAPSDTGTSDTGDAASTSDDGGLSTPAVVAVVVLAAVVVAGIAFVAVGGRRRGDAEDTGS